MKKEIFQKVDEAIFELADIQAEYIYGDDDFDKNNKRIKELCKTVLNLMDVNNQTNEKSVLPLGDVRLNEVSICDCYKDKKDNMISGMYCKEHKMFFPAY